MLIIKGIYEKEGDPDFNGAENHIAQIVNKEQEYKKLDSQCQKGIDAYPKFLWDWKTLMD